MAEIDSDPTTCSFCGKSGEDVRRMIEGPLVRICDECVEICVTIIAEGNDRQRTRDENCHGGIGRPKRGPQKRRVTTPPHKRATGNKDRTTAQEVLNG